MNPRTTEDVPTLKALRRKRRRGDKPVTLVLHIPLEGPPQISHSGNLFFDDVQIAMSAFQSMWKARKGDLSLQECIDKAWAWKEKYDREQADKIANLKKEKPWMCSFCERARFKTERGAKQHERRCSKDYCPECGGSYASASWMGRTDGQADYECRKGHTWVA